jgi:hypothetical protein
MKNLIELTRKVEMITHQWWRFSWKILDTLLMLLDVLSKKAYTPVVDTVSGWFD